MGSSTAAKIDDPSSEVVKNEGSYSERVLRALLTPCAKATVFYEI